MIPTNLSLGLWQHEKGLGSMTPPKTKESFLKRMTKEGNQVGGEHAEYSWRRPTLK